MEKAVPGQRRIPAKDWNEIRDFLNRYAQQPGGMVNNPLNPFLVYVQNNTSNDLPAFSVVKLDGAIYPQRSSNDTKDAALNQLLEISGDTPTGEAGENIGILQEDVPTGQLGKAVVVGASLVYVQVDNANTTYKFAKSISSSEKLQADESDGQTRIVWKESGTGKKLAYVILDQTGTPTPEYFLINPGNDGTQTAANDYSVYTKGSLHYIRYDTNYNAWIPYSQNEGTPATAPQIRPNGVKLVVCQVDAPNSAAEYKIPYFTPESNMGVPPDISTYNQGFNGAKRCGVLMGEHEFTNGGFDYLVTGLNGSAGTVTNGSGTFVYQPQFVEIVQVQGNTGGGNNPTADIFGQTWNVGVPSPSDGLSRASYPDIYPLDVITVLVDCEAQLCLAIDYSRDFPVNDTVVSYNNPGGRGWEATTTPQALADIGLTIYIKVKTGAIT